MKAALHTAKSLILHDEPSGALFHRTGRGVALTELGEIALLRSRSLLHDADEMDAELRAHDGRPNGTVSLGLPPSTVTMIVPRLVNQIRREVPGIELCIYECPLNLLGFRMT